MQRTDAIKKTHAALKAIRRVEALPTDDNRKQQRQAALKKVMNLLVGEMDYHVINHREMEQIRSAIKKILKL